MVEEWSLPGWAVVAAAAALLVLLTLAIVLGATGARRGRRSERELAAARAEADELRARVAAVEQRLDATDPMSATGVADAPDPGRAADEYVITRVGGTDVRPVTPDARAPGVPAPLFADLVLRESLVQAASLAAGVRRALAPESRNRIRFEVRREVRRSRKQRRADLRAARRGWEARRRGPGDAGAAEGSVA